MFWDYFHPFSANLGSIDSQILIGTPKEIVSFCIMRVINIEDIKLCIFDDADVIVTTQLIKIHVVSRLQRCRKIFLSSSCLNAVKNNSERNVSITNKVTLNAMQHFIKTADVTAKLEVIVEIYKMLEMSGGRCIVFCNVSINYKIVENWYEALIFVKINDAIVLHFNFVLVWLYISIFIIHRISTQLIWSVTFCC